MRIRITHETKYFYGSPARGAIQILRLTPGENDGQYVRRWRVDVDQDCRLRRSEDCFGNITHIFSLDGPIEALTITVEGEVETTDTHGMLRGARERFPATLFLRETALTRPDHAIRSFAEDIAAAADEGPLDRLHALTAAIHQRVAFDTGGTNPTTTAAQSFSLGHGVCQDHAHIFISAARTLGIPARYVGGYFHRADGVNDQEAGHAWAEAYLPDLGWVGFDPANGVSPTDQHVRVAIGLDYLGAAPIRGSRIGGAGEEMDVRVTVDEARRQSQN